MKFPKTHKNGKLTGKNCSYLLPAVVIFSKPGWKFLLIMCVTCLQKDFNFRTSRTVKC